MDFTVCSSLSSIQFVGVVVVVVFVFVQINIHQEIPCNSEHYNGMQFNKWKTREKTKQEGGRDMAPAQLQFYFSVLFFQVENRKWTQSSCYNVYCNPFSYPFCDSNVDIVSM